MSYYEKYLSKISLLVSVLLILFIVVSCTPQITDEELEAELAKLTPEEREALLEDLEKEGGALAGQAIAKKYGSSKIAFAGAQRIRTALIKVLCVDSDGGENLLIKGATTGYYKIGQNKELVTKVDRCVISPYNYDGGLDSPPELKIIEIDDYIYSRCVADSETNLQIVNELWKTKGYPPITLEDVGGSFFCSVIEYSCKETDVGQSNSVCQYGCSNGACCPESGCP